MAEGCASSRMQPKSFQPVSSVISMTMLGFLSAHAPGAQTNAAVAASSDKQLWISFRFIVLVFLFFLSWLYCMFWTLADGLRHKGRIQVSF